MNLQQKELHICLDRRAIEGVECLKKINWKNCFIIISAVIFPGSGHVLSKKPVKGLMYVFWIISMGYISWMLTNSSVHFIIRCSGGLTVWIASVLEIVRSNKVDAMKLQ